MYEFVKDRGKKHPSRIINGLVLCCTSIIKLINLGKLKIKNLNHNAKKK